MVFKAFLIFGGVYAKALEKVEMPLIYYCLGRGGAGGRAEAGRGAGPGLLGTGGYCRSGYTTHRLPTNIYSPKGIPRTPKCVRFYLMLHEMSPSRMWKPYLLLSLLLLDPESPEQLTD